MFHFKDTVYIFEVDCLNYQASEGVITGNKLKL